MNFDFFSSRDMAIFNTFREGPDKKCSKVDQKMC